MAARDLRRPWLVGPPRRAVGCASERLTRRISASISQADTLSASIMSRVSGSTGVKRPGSHSSRVTRDRDRIGIVPCPGQREVPFNISGSDRGPRTAPEDHVTLAPGSSSNSGIARSHSCRAIVISIRARCAPMQR